MSAHRQHCMDIPPAPTPMAQVPIGYTGTWRGAIRFWAGMLSAFALVIAVVVTGTRALDTPARVTPIPDHAPIATAQLEPLASSRALQARLEDWRSGYEAAVENGCKLRPLLGSPLGRRP